MLVSIKSKKYIHEYAWLKMSERSAVTENRENLRTTFPFYLCLVRCLALERQSFLLLFSWFEYWKLQKAGIGLQENTKWKISNFNVQKLWKLKMRSKINRNTNDTNKDCNVKLI